MIGLAYLEDPECYAGGSVATGRVSLAAQDEGEVRRREIPWFFRLWFDALNQHSNTRKNVL